MTMIDEWLAKTYGYQSTHFKIDYQRMKTDVEYRMAYVQMNLFAAMLELGEAADEVPWKPWAASTPEQREQLFQDGRDRYVGELVDVLFFIANALTAAGVTDAELRSKYELKGRINKNRQASGTYDGHQTKCTNDGCGRALDDPGIAVVVNQHGAFCSMDCLMNEAAKIKVANVERVRR